MGTGLMQEFHQISVVLQGPEESQKRLGGILYSSYIQILEYTHSS